MKLTSTQQKQVRKVGYSLLGKETVKKSVPVIDRLMQVSNSGTDTDEIDQRNIELVAAGCLAVFLVARGIRHRKPNTIKQGVVVAVALVGILGHLYRKKNKQNARAKTDVAVYP